MNRAWYSRRVNALRQESVNLTRLFAQGKMPESAYLLASKQVEAELLIAEGEKNAFFKRLAEEIREV